MPPKKIKAAQPLDVAKRDSDIIEAFVIRFKESRIPLVSHEFDIALKKLYAREQFRVDSQCHILLKLASVASIVVHQISDAKQKDAMSFLHSFRRQFRESMPTDLKLPEVPKIGCVDFTEQDIIDAYTLRFAAFAGLIEFPKLPPEIFTQVANILESMPVTKAYLQDAHLPVSVSWKATWKMLPLVPSIIIIADACNVAYKRISLTLHGFTARPIQRSNDVSMEKIGIADSALEQTIIMRGADKILFGSSSTVLREHNSRTNIASNAKKDNDNDDNDKDTSFVVDESLNFRYLSSESTSRSAFDYDEDENDEESNIIGKNIMNPNKRPRLTRKSEPLPSRLDSEATAGNRKSARIRYSAPPISEGPILVGGDVKERNWLEKLRNEDEDDEEN